MFSKAISRLRGAMVFLIADLEYTSKVTSIGMFLLSSSTFMESLEPNHVFGRNHVFAVREQYAKVRNKISPQSGWKCSKVPPIT